LAVSTLSRLEGCRGSEYEMGLKRDDLVRSFVERSNAGDADGVVVRREEHAAKSTPPSPIGRAVGRHLAPAARSAWVQPRRRA